MNAKDAASTKINLPIWSDPERLGGRICFKGTRVPVDALFENLEAGLNLEEFLDEFEGVTREQAVAVLEYARQIAIAQDRWAC